MRSRLSLSLRMQAHIWNCDGLKRAYIAPTGTSSNSEDPVAFKPNYARDRGERSRAARARSEEKKRKRDEKTALRKAQRAEAEPPVDGTNPPLEEKQS